MPSSSRLLLQSAVHSPAADPPTPLAIVDSDVVVILAALLCALISVVGLALVARCAWLRRSSSSSSSSSTPPPPPPSKGLKKKALQSLPTVTFSAGEVKIAECPICLAEFAEGEEIRILPRCGHGFHAACVDTWLGSHASCPSCRRTLLVPAATAASSRCRTCGANSDEAHPAPAPAEAVVLEVREEGSCGRFLP
ncbi:RING-H2 finger protein ATL80-like [Typha angustifolia]|uniref:RING-H2 finger protein ATL80-like n=1 Tax=Typha angustifolia TaxID=59011 RepID=UPI003C2F6A5F